MIYYVLKDLFNKRQENLIILLTNREIGPRRKEVQIETCETVAGTQTQRWTKV